MEKVLTFGRYLHRKYHTKVYKIPISISGFTCPNIDGTVTKGGCTFCLNDSFSPNIDASKKKTYLHPDRPNPQLQKHLNELHQQFITTKRKLKEKYGAKKFIVYFQSFTNSYAPLETLQALYEQALDYHDVVGLSIGTRTDCMNEDILTYLQKLNRKNEIWVEYGIQSIFDQTLEKINRGHDYANVKKWITKTKEYGLKVCGHLIYGLPGEDKQMMLQSTRASYDLGIDSVKFHPLYVVKNTKLARELHAKEFEPISMEDYIEVLQKAITIKPRDIVVQRVSAGFDDESLIAPVWCRDNNKQMSTIRKSLREIGYIY
ncbi:MAG: TIGR01212 family radical SAM protein [Campylobacterota bacterium]